MSVPDKSPADRELGSQMLQAAMQTAVGAIIIIDDKGIIANVNPAAERVFGFPETELIGHNVNILMPEPYRSRHDGYIRHHPRPARRRSSASAGR
jgi:two-component system sensor kinase FixL